MNSQSENPGRDDDKGRTIARVIAIVDAIAGSTSGAALQDIARHAGMSASGAHRTLASLVAAGVATQESVRGRYRLGPRFFAWSRGVTRDELLASCAEDALRALRDATGETVLLTILREGRMWNILSLEGVGGLVARATAEQEDLLHSTARGHVFLAHLPREDAERVVHRTGLPVRTPRTIATEAELWRVVDDVRRRGIAWQVDMHELGTAGVAAPVRADGEILGVLALAMPTARLDRGARQRIGTAVVDAARAVERRWSEAVSPPSGSRGRGGRRTT